MNRETCAYFREKHGLERLEPIEKGWSSDVKYKAADKDGKLCLLRITPPGKDANRREMFELTQRTASLGVPMCAPLGFGTCAEGTYSLFEWIDGVELEAALADLPDVEQYVYGVQAGEILQKIHSIPAPDNVPDWAERFNAKASRKIEIFRSCPIQFEGGEAIIAYIEENRGLLENRPQCFQHGDYHVGNMMLDRAGKLRIIDFDRYDFGDPWEEFNRIPWCAQASPHFATGLLNGYFGGEPPMEFWRLLALYLGSNLLSSVSWAIPFGQGEIDTMLNQAKEVLGGYAGMTRVVPSWYIPGVYVQETDGVPYRLKEPFDFSFLGAYGRVFKVYDDQDSGNICFGLEKDGARYFLKFAGAPTVRGTASPEAAVKSLKAAAPLYRTLRHENLVELIESGPLGGGWGLLFRWTDGVSMGRMYPAQHKRFMALPEAERLRAFEGILQFHIHAAEKGYAAVDFYDGTVMYDVKAHKAVLCDIDFYREAPFTNEMGRMWGSLRFMAPEELARGAVIDEVTNVYAMGAMAFALFGGYSRARVDWQLGEAAYRAAVRAVCDARGARYRTIASFRAAWTAALRADEAQRKAQGRAGTAFPAGGDQQEEVTEE